MVDERQKPVWTVSVRELVDFVLRRGDLAGETDFVGAQRGLQGTRAHQRYQRDRRTAAAGYEAEVPVSYDVDAGSVVLRIRGRIDGILQVEREGVIEEIKTTWRRLESANPLHWAQARMYGHIVAERRGWSRIRLQLIYVDLGNQAVTPYTEICSPAELKSFFERVTADYLEWVMATLAWQRSRDASIAGLSFPFQAYRPGQREISVAVYRALGGGRKIFVEASTGIGKTLAVLFPAVKALGEGRVCRIFYFTAKTVGRAIAEQAVAELRRVGLRLRSVTLSARERICVRDGVGCDVATCPLALGYYDRLKPALDQALRKEGLSRSEIEASGEQFQVCPYALGMHAASWADLVIGDFNHGFDPYAGLDQLFGDDAGRCAILVDEAHHLVDRAREMFSASLDARQISEVRKVVRTSLPQCARTLGAMLRAVRQAPGSAGLAEETAQQSKAGASIASCRTPKWEPGELFPQSFGEAREDAEIGGEASASSTCGSVEGIVSLVRKFLVQAEAWLVRSQTAEFRRALTELYFVSLRFLRTAEMLDDDYAIVADAEQVRLFCVDPSRRIRAATERARSAVFFSATLTPLEYFRSVLSGNDEDTLLQVPSPFPAENFQVWVADRVGASYQARQGSFEEVARWILAFVAEQPGNYLVFFPSYVYLAEVIGRVRQLKPDLTVLEQRSSMSETERAEFVAAFQENPEGTLVGFAVMGGLFGEGIDLPGNRLIGAVVVSVGLPQMGRERELIRQYYDRKSGHGFDFAYLYPGMNRVVQAAGRVIRSETDRGVALVIDERFGQARYRRLFPPWWVCRTVRSRDLLRQHAAEFWGCST